MAPRILIIGAGIGGLALAQGLRRRQIDFAVFEKDVQLDSRRQGYRIKIVGEAIGKLRSLITVQAWLEFEATCAETRLGETTLNATSGGIIASRQGRLSTAAPMPYTVDRSMLRRSLMIGIEDSVHFGKSFDAYSVHHQDNSVSVFFEDGSVEIGTLLVGADGVGSRVRKQLLPDVKFLDLESCCIYGKSLIGSDLLERFPPDHRKWMTVVLDQTPMIQSIISGESPITLITEHVQFRNRDQVKDLPVDYIHWGLLFNRSTIGLSDEDLKQALRRTPTELSLQITSEWHPSIRSLLELQDASLTSGIRIISANPDMPAWPPSANVTLLGDAIHVMSPSGGVGAVAALHDSFVLMHVIYKEVISSASIGEYEKQMRDYAKICISRSFAAGKVMLNQSPPRNCSEVDV